MTKKDFTYLLLVVLLFSFIFLYQSHLKLSYYKEEATRQDERIEQLLEDRLELHHMNQLLNSRIESLEIKNQKKGMISMTNNNYIKHLISESMSIKSENQKLKYKIEQQEKTIYSLNDTLLTLRSNIQKLKEKYSQ